MHERLSLLLGVDILLCDVDSVSGPVVVDDLRMVNGDICGPTVEIIDGVTTFAHHLGHQTIGGAHSAYRVVHETGFDLLPPGAEIRQRAGRERHDLELVMLAFPRREFAHRTFLTTGRVYHPLVL